MGRGKKKPKCFYLIISKFDFILNDWNFLLLILELLKKQN